MIQFKFKIDDKLSSNYKLNKKIEKAREMNHVIEAKLITKYVDFDDNNRRTYSGKHEYFIDGKTYRYTAIFHEEQYPPRILYLYYDKTLDKVFTNKQYHYNVLKRYSFCDFKFFTFINRCFYCLDFRISLIKKD